jgi:hypothetical protein
MASQPARRTSLLGGLGIVGGILAATLAAAVLLILEQAATGGACSSVGGSAGGSIVLGPPGAGRIAGATEYGGPGDPSSGTVGSSGVNLVSNPDSYAELGGYTFATADDLGGLPYGTPLRITWGGRSTIAYKQDIGLGGGPIDGYPRVIDLWWALAGHLGIPYEDGRWSGPVKLERTPATGAANTLGQTPALGQRSAGTTPAAGQPPASSCATLVTATLPLSPGSRATLLPSGLAAAPAGAPPAVKAMLAAGNQIAGKPYVYGGGHGLPLSEIAPSYDCSSSVDHILYGAGLLPVASTPTSGELESFGLAGPGRWVTLYANADHVFMYVAGLRWDTWNAAGSGDGSSGIGWHPLVRDAAGFIARHPAGL